MLKPEGDRFVVRCCVCGKERAGDRWVEPEEPESPELTISHSYCPVCFRTLKLRLKQLVAASR